MLHNKVYFVGIFYACVDTSKSSMILCTIKTQRHAPGTLGHYFPILRRKHEKISNDFYFFLHITLMAFFNFIVVIFKRAF